MAKEKNLGGRPRKEIGKKEFENLCGLQCTKEEICNFFDVTDKTLENWCKKTYKKGFSEVFRIKRGKGRISLRRNQFRLSETNASMAIWLGKQYLGQTEEAAIRLEETKIIDPLSQSLMDEAEQMDKTGNKGD